MKAIYTDMVTSSAVDLPEPIPEDVTASVYELCRQSGVLDFWDDEPDLYEENDL